MIKGNNVTTEKHFDLFKRECNKWILIFGLVGWYFHFIHNGEDKEVLGWARCDVVGRVATISLNKNWGNYKITSYEIKRTAFHEVCEVLFASLRAIAGARYIGIDEIMEENHNLIRTLENVIWRPTQK